jgi:hypothetical protein
MMTFGWIDNEALVVIAEHMWHCVGFTVAVAEYEPTISSEIMPVMFPCESTIPTMLARSKQNRTHVICLSVYKRYLTLLKKSGTTDVPPTLRSQKTH